MDQETVHIRRFKRFKRRTGHIEALVEEWSKALASTPDSSLNIDNANIDDIFNPFHVEANSLLRNTLFSPVNKVLRVKKKDIYSRKFTLEDSITGRSLLIYEGENGCNYQELVLISQFVETLSKKIQCSRKRRLKVSRSIYQKVLDQIQVQEYAIMLMVEDLNKKEKNKTRYMLDTH